MYNLPNIMISPFDTHLLRIKGSPSSSPTTSFFAMGFTTSTCPVLNMPKNPSNENQLLHHNNKNNNDYYYDYYYYYLTTFPGLTSSSSASLVTGASTSLSSSLREMVVVGLAGFFRISSLSSCTVRTAAGQVKKGKQSQIEIHIANYTESSTICCKITRINLPLTGEFIIASSASKNTSSSSVLTSCTSSSMGISSSAIHTWGQPLYWQSTIRFDHNK